MSGKSLLQLYIALYVEVCIGFSWFCTSKCIEFQCLDCFQTLQNNLSGSYGVNLLCVIWRELTGLRFILSWADWADWLVTVMAMWRDHIEKLLENYQNPNCLCKSTYTLIDELLWVYRKSSNGGYQEKWQFSIISSRQGACRLSHCLSFSQKNSSLSARIGSKKFHVLNSMPYCGAAANSCSIASGSAGIEGSIWTVHQHSLRQKIVQFRQAHQVDFGTLRRIVPKVCKWPFLAITERFQVLQSRFGRRVETPVHLLGCRSQIFDGEYEAVH